VSRYSLPYDPQWMVQGPGTRLTGLESIPKLLALKEMPTAIIGFNDTVAFGILHGMLKVGLHAGRDLSVIGCDDVSDAALWVPPLTTIHNQHIEMGRLAAEMLIRRISDPTAPRRRIILEPRLIVRETTARIAS
jgi:LacI family transcriptional regulator